MVILEFLKKYGWAYLPGLIFLGINSYVQNLAPGALGDAIDLLSVEVPDRTLVLRQAGIIAAIGAGTFAARFVWRLFIIGNARRMECFLREKLYLKLQRLPLSFFQKHTSGALMAYAINDVGAVRMTFGPVLAMSINSIAVATLAIIGMIKKVDVTMTLLALAPVPFALFSDFYFGNQVQKRFAKVQQLFSKLSGFVNESISGIKVTKAFAKEDVRENSFGEISDDMRAANVNLVKTSSMINPTVSAAFGLSYAIALIFGGNAVIRGEIGSGTLVSFLAYLTLVRQPVTMLGNVVNNIQRGIASWHRLSAIYREPSIPESELTVKANYAESFVPTVDVEDLTYTYEYIRPEMPEDKPKKKMNFGGGGGGGGEEGDGASVPKLRAELPRTPVKKEEQPVVRLGADGLPEKALDGVSFRVKKGGVFGISGTTGSGKTTLLSLIAKLRMLDGDAVTTLPDGRTIACPRSGKITVSGEDVAKIPAATLRSVIGYVPQDGFLFSCTIAENIAFGAAFDPKTGKPVVDYERVRECARLACIADEIEAFPDGYETEVGERGTHLSGGQKQRVSLARALYQSPKLLLLDDTLSAVDNITEHKLIENLGLAGNKRGDMTIIIVSHRLSALVHCDEIIQLDEGKIIERGTHEELLRQNGVYAATWYKQAEEAADGKQPDKAADGRMTAKTDNGRMTAKTDNGRMTAAADDGGKGDKVTVGVGAAKERGGNI